MTRNGTADTEISRDHDMQAMLAYALGHAPYREAIDPAHIGALGHSLGGYTVLGMAGAWPSLHDPRIKAVAALAPFSAPYLDQQTLGRIAVPVFYGAGTEDDLIEPELVRASYGMAHAPRSLLVLQGADHFSWTDLSPTYQATIAPYVVAFFDRELRHKPTPWPSANAQVAQFEHAP